MTRSHTPGISTLTARSTTRRRCSRHSHTAVAGTYNVRLQVTDNQGASDVSDPVVITAAGATNSPPVARIDSPQSALTWRVGDVINFSGSATDPQQGTLPASALSWSLILHHCPSSCHTHPLQTFQGVASGSFTAPDHDYPSHLELRLTATDSGGLTDTESVLLNPQTVHAVVRDRCPPGFQLVHAGTSSATPFQRTVIANSNNSISAPTPQTLGGVSYGFVSWSDGGAQTHNITASASTTYTATYKPRADVGIQKTGVAQRRRNTARLSVAGRQRRAVVRQPTSR